MRDAAAVWPASQPEHAEIDLLVSWTIRLAKIVRLFPEGRIYKGKKYPHSAGFCNSLATFEIHSFDRPCHELLPKHLSISTSEYGFPTDV